MCNILLLAIVCPYGKLSKDQIVNNIVRRFRSSSGYSRSLIVGYILMFLYLINKEEECGVKRSCDVHCIISIEIKTTQFSHIVNIISRMELGILAEGVGYPVIEISFVDRNGRPPPSPTYTWRRADSPHVLRCHCCRKTILPRVPINWQDCPHWPHAITAITNLSSSSNHQDYSKCLNLWCKYHTISYVCNKESAFLLHHIIYSISCLIVSETLEKTAIIRAKNIWNI